MMGKKFTTLILIGMILGIAIGWACNAAFPDPKTAAQVAGYISIITDVFLRMIKMIIAPLVFSTLVVGIAHMGDSTSVGRIGGKTMLWFVGASLVSLAARHDRGQSPAAWRRPELAAAGCRHIYQSQGLFPHA